MKFNGHVIITAMTAAILFGGMIFIANILSAKPDGNRPEGKLADKKVKTIVTTPYSSQPMYNSPPKMPRSATKSGHCILDLFIDKKWPR